MDEQAGQKTLTTDQRLIMLLGAMTRAHLRAAGMQAENNQRLLRGDSIVYSEEAFAALIAEEGIDADHVRQLVMGS